MSSEPVRRLSPEDYLAFERQAETKHEYVAGEVFAMTGASARHNVIVVNLITEIGVQFRGRPGRVFPGDQRVAVTPDGPFYYPDLSALCAEPRFLDDRFDTLLNPEVAIEVLSPSTEAFVRGVKFSHYRAIHSVQEVVFIAQDAVRAEHFVRRESEWVLSDHAGLEATFELPALGCRLEMARVYDRVEGLPVER